MQSIFLLFQKCEKYMAGGFELTTPCSQSRSSSTAPPGHSYKI